MLNKQSSEMLLNIQHQQLLELKDLLIAEKDILQKQTTPDELTLITEQKATLLQAIETTDKTLSQHNEFLEKRAAGEYSEQLAVIENTLIECKNLNQVNGSIIQHSTLAVERMKSSLLENHNRMSMTYDNKGKKSAGLSSLDLKA
jgi:flagella synthesis protein FlgN